MLLSKIFHTKKKFYLLSLFSAHIVNPQWLLDCCEKGELIPEIGYLSSLDRDEK